MRLVQVWACRAEITLPKPFACENKPSSSKINKV